MQNDVIEFMLKSKLLWQNPQYGHMLVYLPSVNCKDQFHGGLKRLFIMMVFPISPLESQFYALILDYS